MPILPTKLYTPPPPPKTVARPRLIEMLNEGLHRRLTPVSAPAGFGKTTLLSAWTVASDLPVAWLSLDEGDSDPARFLTYLIAALRGVAPGIQEGLSAALQSPHLPPLEPILTAPLNEISALSGDIVLVLDDYHAIEVRPGPKA
jgi:LuxR family transcriptional regulator, maltose regulon positive regulatory protein